MSILDGLIPGRHLSDAALAELWTASACPEPDRGAAGGDSASARHLETCADCRARHAAFTGWMDGLREEAIAEADAAFPADRLAAQQAQVLKRLEAMERPVRVIAFPKFAQPVAGRPSLAYRWVAVAAAAGLVIGVAIGQWMDFAPRFQPQAIRTPDLVVTASPAARQDDVTLQSASARTMSDEALLSEIEASLNTTPLVDPLRAIDTITPRSRDYSTGSR